ncbi:MAG: M20/M25/M40 family metallo-hydrolase [Chloroflexota bacterium]|nr:MAG: M20/M25/M40 family metallo-hydrolase [Chloroflexota bacterium]
METLIRRLVEAYGPSGFEVDTRTLIEEEVGDYVDKVRVDAMGNLIVHKSGDGTGMKVMIAAHMDEIGVMVTHVTEKGFLRFTNIGGLRRQTLMGARVIFSSGLQGVIYSEKLESIKQVHPLQKHYIDVGATGRDDCPVEVGMAAGFSRDFVTRGGHYISKSMDDRIGCAVAIESLKRLTSTPHELYFVFSVQEEVGTRGAEAAANALAPDVGIAVDVTMAGDTPGAPIMAVELGDGPAIKVKDSGMISHAGLVQHMRKTADEAGIPYQLEVLEGGSTDARPMQIAGAGCAAGCLSIPCRYVHSQSETVDVEDVENSVKLLTEMLSKPIVL